MNPSSSLDWTNRSIASNKYQEPAVKAAGSIAARHLSEGFLGGDDDQISPQLESGVGHCSSCRAKPMSHTRRLASALMPDVGVLFAWSWRRCESAGSVPCQAASQASSKGSSISRPPINGCVADHKGF